MNSAHSRPPQGQLPQPSILCKAPCLVFSWVASEVLSTTCPESHRSQLFANPMPNYIQVPMNSLAKARYDTGDLFWPIYRDVSLKLSWPYCTWLSRTQFESETGCGQVKLKLNWTVMTPFFLQAFLPLLRKAAQLSTGMGCHRAAIINMSSVAASMQLVQANEVFLKVYPYRIAKVSLSQNCAQLEGCKSLS